MMLAVVLFAMAATGGLVLAGIRFSGRPYPPLALALVHGAAAGSALVALILAVAGGDTPVAAKVSLAMFLGAAVGGDSFCFRITCARSHCRSGSSSCTRWWPSPPFWFCSPRCCES